MIKTSEITKYHVPASVGAFLLEASELASVVNGHKELPDEQKGKTDEDDAADHAENYCQHAHRLGTPCTKTHTRTTCNIYTDSPQQSNLPSVL